MSHLLVTAPAKINLSLDIVNRRADGYHLLATVMQSLDLADLLRIDVKLGPAAAHTIEISSNLAQLPLDNTNTAWRAARIFLDGAKIQPGLQLKIHIEKKIPLAAGLAGGSSNAAAVLFALNQIFPNHYTDAELFLLAAQVGADVPFCLKGGTVLCEGIGEILTKLPDWNDLAILLALPDQALLTKDVFTVFNLAEKTAAPATAALVAAVEAQDLAGLARSAGNVLEKVSFSLLPELAELKDQLLQTGAIMAQMTGSGPSLFAVYANRAVCLAAEESLRLKLPGLKLVVCRSLAGGPQILEQEEADA